MKEILLQNTAVHTGCLILVNSQHGYREPEALELVSVAETGPGVLLDCRAATPLMKLMSRIHGRKHIAMVSGWRSRDEQQAIWDDSIARSGEAFTGTFVAVPGHSEHQTGLAIDLGLKTETIDFICPDFPYDGICNTFREYAACYGFVERYPANKEEVTHIGHEPWHFRYVGMPHACIMKERNLTLEEYLELLRKYPYGKRTLNYRACGLNIAVSYLPAAEGAFTGLFVGEERPYTISGDNIDGFILTEWRETHGRPETLRRA